MVNPICERRNCPRCGRLMLVHPLSRQWACQDPECGYKDEPYLGPLAEWVEE